MGGTPSYLWDVMPTRGGLEQLTYAHDAYACEIASLVVWFAEEPVVYTWEK